LPFPFRDRSFYVFLDDMFVMYTPPTDSKIWSTLQQSGDDAQVLRAQE